MAEGGRFDAGLVEALVRGHPAGPALSWLEDGTGSIANMDEVAALSVIEAAFRTQRFDRLELARSQATRKVVRKFASRALHRARSTGHTVGTPRSGARWALGRERRAVLPPVAFVGFPEPDGYSPFMFGAARDDELVAVVMGEFGIVQGHRGTESGLYDRVDFRKMLAQARGQRSFTEVPAAEALRYLRRAFDGVGRQPRGWPDLLLNLSPKLVDAAQQNDPLLSMPRRPDPAAYDDRSPLLPTPLDLSIEAPRQPREVALRALSAQDPDAPRTALVKTVLDTLCRDAFDGPFRRSWAFALEVTTWLLRRRGLDQQALRTWHARLALNTGVPGDHIGLLRQAVARRLADYPAARWLSTAPGLDPGPG